MRITYRGDYALKAILDLAVHYEQGLVTINELAERIDAPTKFLEQVLLDLKKGGFVESKRGNVGGYQLARRPVDITLGQVVRYIDGPIEPIACVERGYSNCFDLNRCVFNDIWKKVTKSTSDVIDSVTFESLRQKVSSSMGVLTYSI